MFDLPKDSHRSETQKIDINNLWGFVICFAIFCGGYVMAFPLAAKVMDVGPFIIPVGAAMGYCLTFPCTDIVGEVYGHKFARKMVLGGFIAILTAAILIQFTLALPGSTLWHDNSGFDQVLGFSTRVYIASLAAFLAAQYSDVWIFSVVRRLFGTKRLWLRNNISTAISQLIDSVIFFGIGFYGLAPVGELILGAWLFKWAIAVIDTPFVYLGVYLIRKYSPDLKT